MSSWFSFLASRGARLDATGVMDFGDPAAELAAARDHAVLVDLSHNAILAVTGDDATAFLHGQLTNDLQSLPEGAAQWSGWCSAKGRLLATFLLLRRADGYLLMLPAEIAGAVAKRLGMFVLRSKVKIADASDSMVRLAFAGKTAAVIVARELGFTPDPMRSVEKNGATCIALDAERFVILAPMEKAPALWEKLAENAAPAGPDAWAWSLVRAGIPVVTAATQEAFVPQMANFDLVGGLSFRKGCYPGQEIVARTQYRGILKRRMAIAHLSGDLRPAAGESLYGAAFGEQAAGTILNVAPAPGGGYDVLVVAQLESLAEGDLRWRSLDGPRLEIREKPYEREPAEPLTRA
ncbi:MAG TPA: folate-binding protein YgfZ [Usitatibacter sp.]|nr:folate-binding protein YgfZ [Usitatibacter sp.]